MTSDSMPQNGGERQVNLSAISIIICTLNEGDNLVNLLPKISNGVHEVIVVDGYSTDNTVAVVKQLLPEAEVVLQKPRGRGDALICGAKAATGDYLLFLDADGSQQPEEIPLYIQKINEGYDMVKGSRFLPEGRSEDETLFRRLIIRIAQWIANLLWRTNFTDTPYGLCLIDRNKFLSLDIKAPGFDFEWEVAAKAARDGLRITEVPAVELRRIYGESRLHVGRDGIIIAKVVFGEFLKGILQRNKSKPGG